MKSTAKANKSRPAATTLAAPASPAALQSLGQDPEMIADFVVESNEHVQTIENNLLRLEKNGADTEAIHAAFRAFHTIKGLAGFLDLLDIREVAHEVETILDRARNAELTITPAIIDLVLESTDYVRKWLRKLEAGSADGEASGPGSNTDLIARIVKRLNLSKSTDQQEEDLEMRPCEPSETDPTIVDLQVLAETVATFPEFPLADIVDSSPHASAQTLPDPAIQPQPHLPAPAVVQPVNPPVTELPESKPRSRPNEARSVRVDTSKLDHLVDTVGEMVIAQSMIQHDPEFSSINRPRLVRNLGQLARITNEVHKTAMAMRMVPVGQLFQRMARVVRDLTRRTGKEAELELSGEDTELDRNLVEELADPLMHMLRNSVDHGIETPERRAACGKPKMARLRLRASHQSGNIVIEVSDDGNGLDRTKILDKAIRSGLVAENAPLTDSDVFNLIFQPGFSTADQLTDVSGRGVGMDVVRRQVQKLRGRVEIHSTAGQGTVFLLKLPLTLAIVEGLVVGVGTERYVMPLFAIREMLRPTESSIFTVQDQGEMALVRDRLLPMIRLYRRFGVRPRSELPTESLLIVAESASQPFAILVDELLGKQEVVIKSLGPLLQNTPGIAGGAILGDGRVGLILDLDRIFQSKGGDHGAAHAS